MRPDTLFPLFAPVSNLQGVGPRVKNLIAKLAGENIISLCWRLPIGLIDRSKQTTIEEASHESARGETVTLEVTVGAHHPPRFHGRTPYRVSCHDETGDIQLIFFRAHGDYLRRALPETETRFISGKVEIFKDKAQMVHPDHILTAEEFAAMPIVEPVYRVMSGISSKQYGRIVREGLKEAPHLPEWQDPQSLKEKGWQDWRAALLGAHHPESDKALLPQDPHRMRLAYDECLAGQLALALTRQWMRRLPGRIFPQASALHAKTENALPFSLTKAQRAALAEISADMQKPIRMLRLLQGDVGSGKTIIAFLSMLNAIEAGAQAALMAPTELLAKQHAQTLAPLCEAMNLRLESLAGRESASHRQHVLKMAKEGACDILVGTHSLFQKSVEFRDLGLCVIDEQHRFGVHQRLRLSEKGQKSVDMLVMTATPIPRTLALTAYGDMDISRLHEKPPGRRPVRTRAMPLSRLEEITGAVQRAAKEGRQIYWICPLVGEEEKDEDLFSNPDDEGRDASPLPLTATKERYEYLTSRLTCGVGLVHGRMKGEEKERVLKNFQEGTIQLLVATTVIEVGIDVPNASVMIIEDAQRFGLAQLHQMRGRVGRGKEESSCLLLYREPLGEIARQRLEALRATQDGFEIAEKDLILRGGGEILGTKQSGVPDFRFFQLPSHSELLESAYAETTEILKDDPHLSSERGQALRTLLYLFGQDEAVLYLRSG